MAGPAVYGLVQVDVAVADFNIEATFGIGARPGLEVDGGSLPAEIGERDQITGTAGLALGQVTYVHQFLLGPKLTQFVPAVVQSAQPQGVAWATWMCY